MRAVVLVGLLAVTTTLSPLCVAEPTRPVPTYSSDAAAILTSRCVGCHRAGEIGAAVPLTSYTEARSRAESIRGQLVAGLMPPWFADSGHSLPFRNDPRLSARELETLLAWIDGGTPEGPSPPPSAPAARESDWHHPSGRKPDAVITLPEFSVQANAEVPYVRFRVKVPFKDDRWISALEVRPGNRAIVHHMAFAEVGLAEGVTAEDLEALSGVAHQLGLPPGALEGSRPVVPDPENAQSYDMLGMYVPGSGFEAYGDGNAKLLKGGGSLFVNVNVHYTATNQPEKDLSRIGFWFTHERPRNIVYRVPAPGRTILANGQQLMPDDPGTKAEGTDVAIPPVPPFADNYELVGVTAYERAVTIYQFRPHAHMRGKDFQYDVVYPDGRRVTALSVPRYDFHWQLAYDLETPLELPPGSKLVVTAHYDNSKANAQLQNLGDGPAAKKCGPDQEAYFRNQNQSWDEMFAPVIQYSVVADDLATVTPRAAGRSGHAARAEIVESVGCLVTTPTGAWELSSASAPRKSQSQSATRADLAASAKQAMGRARVSLVGTWPFHPESVVGRRVWAKGAMLRDAAAPRINVTSLLAVGDQCR